MVEAAAQMEQLCQIGRLAYDKGMVTGSGGNLSFRWGDGMYITPHGITLDSITLHDLIFVSLSTPYTGERIPSVETELHKLCYRKRPDISAIVHLHSYYSILAGILAGEEVMPAYTGSYACKVGQVGLVPLRKSGDPTLNNGIADALTTSNVVLMKNHGVIACGNDLRSAFNLCEDTEMNARLHIQLQGVGALTDEQLAALK